tara:strand:- start:58 stop:513 length:456 start_codon:yes stop_codon:yes gene_type:complete
MRFEKSEMQPHKKTVLTGALICVVSLVFLLIDLTSNYEQYLGAAIGRETVLVTSKNEFEIRNENYKGRNGPRVYAYHAEPVRGKLIHSLSPIEAGTKVDCLLVNSTCFAKPAAPFDYLKNSRKRALWRYLGFFILGLLIIALSKQIAKRVG